MKTNYFKLLLLVLVLSFSACNKTEENITPDTPTKEDNLPNVTGYPIVGTNQTKFFNNTTSITSPSAGQDFYGQDAHYSQNAPNYVKNDDGTVTDMVTGLMWQQSFDHNGDGVIDINDKKTYDEILAMMEAGVSYAGYDDWRLPTIKEMYSLILFSGRDVSSYSGTSTEGLIPFMDTETFEFGYGDLNGGERLIDMQCATTAVYKTSEMSGTMVFGVNFADGRIKAYGTTLGPDDKYFNFLLVRGRTDYGVNNYVNNGDGTITDNATGLMWMQADNIKGVTWQEALKYAEDFTYAGHSDWRLPNAKELESLIDYERSPSHTSSAAIDPLFTCTSFTNEDGKTDYPYYWTNTTHESERTSQEGANAVYLSFGRALGYMNGNWIDIHGAGAQRSDPKTGDPSAYPTGNGPQGDAIRIYNYVRLVRNN